MTLARRSRSASAWPGHGAAHLLGQVDLLHLDGGDLHAPGLGVPVDDLLELPVDLVALREQVVELHLAEHRAQRGLGELAGGEEEVGDLEEGLARPRRRGSR